MRLYIFQRRVCSHPDFEIGRCHRQHIKSRSDTVFFPLQNRLLKETGIFIINKTYNYIQLYTAILHTVY